MFLFCQTIQLEQFLFYTCVKINPFEENEYKLQQNKSPIIIMFKAIFRQNMLPTGMPYKW